MSRSVPKRNKRKTKIKPFLLTAKTKNRDFRGQKKVRGKTYRV